MRQKNQPDALHRFSIKTLQIVKQFTQIKTENIQKKIEGYSLIITDNNIHTCVWTDSEIIDTDDRLERNKKVANGWNRCFNVEFLHFS